MAAVLKPESLRILPMTPSHLDQVMEIELTAYPFPWSRGNFADSLNAGYCAWVVERDRKIIGYFLLLISIDEAHLLNITVAPDYWRQGIGRFLIEQVFDMARGHRATRLFLEVRPSNEAARRLYDAVGMKKIGLRRNYYPYHAGHREDALVLAMDLQ